MADNSNRKPTPEELKRIEEFNNSPPANIPSSNNYSNYSGYSNRPPTAEELRRINEFNSGGSTNIYTEERPDFSNYVKPEYTPEPKPDTINIPVIPEIPDSYWAKPENIIKEYNNYRANPDLPEPEYGPDRKDLSMAYDYLAQKNRGKPQTEWEPITVRDPLWQTVLSKWSDPTKPQTPEDQAIVDYTNEILTPPEPVGTWEELSPVGKIAKSLVGTGSKLEGEPGFTKITEAIIPAVGSFAPGYLGGLAVGAGLAAAGAVAAPAIGTIALVGGIGTALLQGINYITGKDNPILNKVGNWLDIFSQSGEKAFVGAPAVIKSTHPEIDKNVEWGYTNPNLEARGYEKKPSYLGDAVDNFLDLAVEVVKMPFGKSDISKEELETAWQVGAIGLEQNPFIANTALNIMNRIGGYETADYGEYYRYELGTNEPQAPTIPPDELNRALVQAVNVYNGLINPNTNKPYTSREIEDDILLRAATNQYGIAGALNDVIGQEVLDITNYMPPLMGAFGTVVGKATGNQNLVKAAEINRGEAVADIAPFPLNALSGKKQSGGITDLIDTYKKVLRGELTTNPPKVEDLSTFDRAIADITPEGKYAELQPGQATGKLAWVKNLSKLTEESKAILYTDDFANVVSELSLMSDSPVTWRENIMKMADMMEVKQGDSVAAIYGTAVQKTLSDGFRAIVESGAIDQITSKWQATEGLRSNLTVISSQLNLTPDEFIKLTRDQPNAAKSMIRDYAALNNNMIMNQVLTDDGTQIIDQFKVFTDKKDPLPYRFEQVATEYAVTITDKLSDYVVKVYNIKPQSLAIRLSDLMKRIQSVLLLGFSPSFPANNLINDVITRASVGVFGFPNSETWVDRMKIQTARMQESMSEFRGGIDQTQSPLTSVKEKINAKMHPGDSVDRLSALIGQASSKAPFSKLSGYIEAAESARANTVGQMQYMHYMWKPGKAIDLMDPVLESQIDAEIPNGSKLVYTALQNSLNKDEIRKNLYGDYVKPNAQSIMDSIVKENYPIDADTVNELFGKSGALVQLQTLLDNAKTPEEQAQAVEYIRGKMAATARIYMDNQVMHDAENIKNDVTAAGDRQQRIAKLFEYLDYLSDTRANQWINTRERYAGAYAKKLQESMTVTEWRNYISSVAAQNQAQWNTYYAHERQAYTGILRGLGLNDDVTARYSNYVLDYQNNWKEFYDLQRQNIKKYYDGDLTWDDYIADMDQAYEDHFQNELLIQDKMNNLFLQAYHESLGLDTTELKSLMDQIIEVRNDMHNMQLDIRQRTRNMTDDLKNEAYLEFETDYNSRIRQIAQLHDKINEILGTDPAELRRKQSGQPVKDAPPVEQLSDFERAATFVRNEYEAEVTDNIRDQAEANFQKTIDTDEVDTGEYSIPEEEPPEFVAFTQKNFDYGFPVTIQELKLMELVTQTDLIATPESDLRSFELVPEYTGAEFYLDKLYAKKVNAYQLGDYVITAHIYDGDKLVALYANLPMKEIKVTGKTIDVLGIDPEDQKKFVFLDKENVIKVDPAKDIPKDFAVEEQPNIPNGQHKQPPLNMPTGEAYAELMNKYVHPILDQFLPRYKQELINNKNAKHFSKLSEPAKIALENYVDDIGNKLAITKYNAIKYGEMKRDQALLNYNKRYGFDTYLTVISPYQFWYTRTMINWAKRMIDRPVWYTTYYRLKQKEELFARDDIPARLDGRFRINMPYLEDWMGGAFYTDVLSQLFPFAQFINRGEYYMNSQNQLIKNTEYLLKEQLDEGIIGAQEYLDAVKNRNNIAWKAAFAEISGSEKEDPMLGGLFQQYLSLPFLVDWYIKKSRGKEKEIFNLPITRTGLTLQTLLKETPLEPVGDIVGQALTLPEQGLRKLYDIDYNELGTYGDYAIKKQISQMGNAGEISREEMLDAQRSMSGPIYEEAYRRQREELMLATQGAAAIDAMTEFLKGNASFTDVLRALFVAPFSGKIYPKDEQELRQQNKLRQQAYADQDSGKKPDAVSEFYEQYPAYIGRTASFMDDPEKLNKYVAYQQITDMYYSLPYAEQVAIRDALGPDFYNAIINKETRNYEAVPLEDLLTWEYAMRGDNPNIPASAIIKANAPKIQYFTPEVVQTVDEWSAIENTKYKNIKVIQNGYYALPKSERKAYLIAHPELQSYWDDKHSFEATHPEYVEYSNIRSSMYDEIMVANCFAEMSDSVMSDLEYTTITGAKLRPASVTKLKYLYEKYADPSFDTFDEFVEKLRRYK